VQPRLGLCGVGDARRQVDRGGVGDVLGDEALQARAPLTLGQDEQNLVVDAEQVEGDEAARRALGQHRDTAGGRVDALAQQVELLAAALVEDDDLAVQDVAPGRERQLGEVARQRLAVARLDLRRVAVDEDDRAEAVPLGLI